MKEGDEYEFRVVAVNKAGPGEPSDPSRMVKVKPRNLAPSLDMSALKDIKVKAGQSIHFKVPISGEPTPTAIWTVNGKPLPTDSRVEEEKQEEYVILEIKNAKRSDKGKYTLTLENVNGSKAGTANVEVLDKPSAPTGPLTANDIHKEGCTLAWKAPEGRLKYDVIHSKHNYFVKKKLSINYVLLAKKFIEQIYSQKSMCRFF